MMTVAPKVTSQMQRQTKREHQLDIFRPTWVEVDLDAIAHNVSQAAKAHAGKELFAVVKANGYGHGDLEVGLTALENGATALAVSSFEEAMHLKNHDFSCPVLVMGVTEISYVTLAADKGITLTAHDPEWISALSDVPLVSTLNLHLKIDTGMHRIGVLTHEEAILCIELIDKLPHVELEGIFTHMATADEANQDYFQHQVEAFKRILATLDISKVKYIHLANSATLLQHAFDFEHAVRFGISMYGVDPTGGLGKHGITLKPTFSLYSSLAQVKLLPAGSKVGYGATYECQTDEWIGAIPIGYADGWIRQNQGRSVVIDGHECEIVGRVCMDQMMVRLPKRFEMGTRVTLIGAGMPVERVAAEMETIPYETFCIISDRVPRVYYKDGKPYRCQKMRFD